MTYYFCFQMIIRLLLLCVPLVYTAPIPFCKDDISQGKILTFNSCTVLFCYKKKVVPLVRDDNLDTICIAEPIVTRQRACVVDGVIYQRGTVISYDSTSLTLTICLGGLSTMQVRGKRNTFREILVRSHMSKYIVQ